MPLSKTGRSVLEQEIFKDDLNRHLQQLYRLNPTPPELSNLAEAVGRRVAHDRTSLRPPEGRARRGARRN